MGQHNKHIFFLSLKGNHRVWTNKYRYWTNKNEITYKNYGTHLQKILKKKFCIVFEKNIKMTLNQYTISYLKSDAYHKCIFLT